MTRCEEKERGRDTRGEQTRVWRDDDMVRRCASTEEHESESEWREREREKKNYVSERESSGAGGGSDRGNGHLIPPLPPPPVGLK